jgi:mannose-6-phosphate isomerase-like protein (cupin superfamily)
MEIKRIEDMKGGWFIGNFEPSAYRTSDFEVCYKVHPKGEQWPAHYHKIATEINYIIRGSMTINGTLLSRGDVFVLEPYEVAVPEFLEDCELIVVKTASVVDDKYEV